MATSVINNGTSSSILATQYVVLGGTFDPVHNGHLVSARAIAQTMGYQQVYLMPCGDAYHKAGSSSAAHRLAMLTLALKIEPTLSVDDAETRRKGATYTVDTLKALRVERGEIAHIVWVMGTDAAAGLTHWHHWQELFTLANVLVIARPGERAICLDHWGAQEFLDKTDFKTQPFGCFMQLTLDQVDISSSELRQSIKKHEVVDNHVPQPVIEYIERHGLYRG
jgi:nicotinate-nucleotide adenylyltransferase